MPRRVLRAPGRRRRFCRSCGTGPPRWSSACSWTWRSRTVLRVGTARPSRRSSRRMRARSSSAARTPRTRARCTTTGPWCSRTPARRCRPRHCSAALCRSAVPTAPRRTSRRWCSATWRPFSSSLAASTRRNAMPTRPTNGRAPRATRSSHASHSVRAGGCSVRAASTGRACRLKEARAAFHRAYPPECACFRT